MYVCICHGFTDSQVRKAHSEGVRRVPELYSSLCGSRPQCGKCVGDVKKLLVAGDEAPRQTVS